MSKRVTGGDLARIGAGVVLGVICVRGIFHAITNHTGEMMSMVIAGLVVLVCLLFLVIAAAMIMVSLPVMQKRMCKKQQGNNHVNQK